MKWTFQKLLKYRIFSLKSQYLFSGNAICNTKAPLTKWASQIYWKYQVLQSKQAFFVKLVSQNSSRQLFSSKISLHLTGYRGFCTDSVISRDPQPVFRNPKFLQKAQSALLEYLHCTSGLDFLDAEHISKNSPIHLRKLLDIVERSEDGIDKALSRFLRYHPPNEFELFFESIGLKPFEFDRFLPRDLMYLKDDPMLMDNYHVLCNYGIARDKIGKVYNEAVEVFGYEVGVLESKLQAYQNLGLSKTCVIKIVASSPCLLIGDVNSSFLKVLEGLEKIEIERDWIGGVLCENNLYHWDKMPILLHSCIEIGLTTQELEFLIRKHPDFLLDGSGKFVVSIIVLLLKLGVTKEEIISLLKEFPQVKAKNFMHNLREGLLLLVKIEMKPLVAQKIIRSHLKFFGLNTLKKPSSLLTELSTGRKRLCKIIEENPDQMKKYVKGCKLYRLPNIVDDERSLLKKREFLLGLGFVEDSQEMKRVIKHCRGRGDELKERFNYLVKQGLDRNDVSSIIKRCPHILNQTTDVLDRKINHLVHNMGVPLNSLIAFPQYLSFTIGRVKTRLFMYKWLKDRGNAPNLALSTVLACSDIKFRKRFIDSHPEGPKMWENIKELLSSGDL